MLFRLRDRNGFLPGLFGLAGGLSGPTHLGHSLVEGIEVGFLGGRLPRQFAKRCLGLSQGQIRTRHGVDSLRDVLVRNHRSLGRIGGASQECHALGGESVQGVDALGHSANVVVALPHRTHRLVGELGFCRFSLDHHSVELALDDLAFAGGRALAGVIVA